MTDPAADGTAVSPSTKADLRRAALTRRDALRPDLGRIAAARLVDLVAEALADTPAEAVVAGFWPIRSEIDPRPALEHLAASGRPLVLPALIGGGATMVFRRWRPGEALVKGAFGLSEPPATAPEIDPGVLLMPLAAFDRAGHRIGYGGGYYDRALERLEATGPRLKIGLAFAVQEVARVPAEPHDRPLDLILTEAGPITPAGDPT